jgi:hypothetical protein
LSRQRNLLNACGLDHAHKKLQFNIYVVFFIYFLRGMDLITVACDFGSVSYSLSSCIDSLIIVMKEDAERRMLSLQHYQQTSQDLR